MLYLVYNSNELSPISPQELSTVMGDNGSWDFENSKYCDKSLCDIRTEQVSNRYHTKMKLCICFFLVALLNGVKNEDETHSIKSIKTKFDSPTEAAKQIAELVQKLSKIGDDVNEITKIKGKY